VEGATHSIETLGEAGTKVIEGFESLSLGLGIAIGGVTLLSGVREAYKGGQSYVRARNLASIIKNNDLINSADNTVPLKTNKTEHDTCLELKTVFEFAIQNNTTRAGDRALIAALEITVGTVELALTAATSGISLGASIGVFAATEGSKKLLTVYRANQEAPVAAARRKATAVLTNKLEEIKANLDSPTPVALTNSDQLMLEGLKAVGLLSKQIDVNNREALKIGMTAITEKKLRHAFTKSDAEFSSLDKGIQASLKTVKTAAQEVGGALSGSGARENPLQLRTDTFGDISASHDGEALSAPLAPGNTASSFQIKTSEFHDRDPPREFESQERPSYSEE
jgi:flagellin-like hook-associated protein FlgL